MILLGLGVFLREFQGVDTVAPIGSYACTLLALMSVLTFFSFPEGRGVIGQVEIDSSVGYSFFLTLIGALTGAVAGHLRETGGWDGGAYIPIAPGPGAKGIEGLPNVMPQQPASYEYTSRIRDATATEKPLAERGGLGKIKGASSTPDASVDQVRGAVRYVARSIELNPVGMSAILEGGGMRDILWSDVGRVVARRLPVDPPYDKTLFLDVVPTAPPRQPIRLLASTQANYASLPGGAAMSSRENLARLGLMIEEAKPGVLEPHSEPFFRQSQAPPMFQAIKQFADYDSQYEE